MENEAPVAVQPESSHKSRAKIIIVVLGVMLVLGALATAAYFSLERPIGLTEELMERGLFVSAEETYIYRDGSFMALETDGFQILESKQSNGHNAFIARYENGAYSLRVDGEQKVTSVYPMRGLALSPEGTKVAYAEQMGGGMGSTNVADWKVTVIDFAEGGETRTYTESFSPYFLGDAHMVRFTGEGVVYFELISGVEDMVASMPFTDVSAVTYQSPNRRALAWETLLEDYSSEPVMMIVGLTQVSPLEHELLGVREINTTVQYSLGDEGLYELRSKARGSDLWVRTLEQPEARKVFEIPRELGITHVTFQ